MIDMMNHAQRTMLNTAEAFTSRTPVEEALFKYVMGDGVTPANEASLVDAGWLKTPVQGPETDPCFLTSAGNKAALKLLRQVENTSRVDAVKGALFSIYWAESVAQYPDIAGADTGRLPLGNELLAILDRAARESPACAVSIAALVEKSLVRVDEQLDVDPPVTRAGLRVSFTAAVFEIVGQLVVAGDVEYVRAEIPTVRRKVDEIGLANMAMDAGEDPERSVEEVTGRKPRYRQGPCYFWRENQASRHVVTIARERKSNALSSYGRWGYTTVFNEAWSEPAPLAFRVDVTCGSRAIDARYGIPLDSTAAQCELVPEHIARRMEQAGWIPYYIDMPPTEA